MKRRGSERQFSTGALGEVYSGAYGDTIRHRPLARPRAACSMLGSAARLKVGCGTFCRPRGGDKLRDHRIQTYSVEIADDHVVGGVQR